MKDRVHQRLEDALFAATTIQNWTSNHSREQIETDLLVESAYVRQFEIIGEALRVVRDADGFNHDDFPRIHEWVSLRHHLIHEYRDVDRDLLWQFATLEIPHLISQLEALLYPPSTYIP